jgi:hypothetical protein
MGEDDDQDPDNFGVPLIGFLSRTVHEHPNPESCQRHNKARQEGNQQ